MDKMVTTLSAMVAGLVLAGGAARAGTWREYEGNPVLGDAKLGTCFDVNVVTEGPAPYTMYFSWRPKKAIALVRSADGFAWTHEPEICLEADPTSGWEDDLNRSCTVRKDGVWHMWYTGQANGGSKIGYATSKDGVRFTRVRREPVMVPERDYEKLSVMNPYVRWDAKRSVWRMWYAAGETYEPNVLCYAESKDGLNWTKWDRNPMFAHGEGIVWDRDRVGACEVHPLPDGRWAMFYIGYSDIDTARIGCAISPDGVTGWKRLAQNPIVAPDLGTWNGSACYKPSVVRDERNNRWLLWYNGRNGAPEYVGMAVHEGLDLEAPNLQTFQTSQTSQTSELLSSYVRRFNEKDEELYTNAIPNSAAEGFLLANVPRFACPDKDIERTYYFRWWTFRKHLKRGEKGGWRVTEFLPKVVWSGKDNTIVCPAGHHLREGRWLRDSRIIEDNARFWLSDPEATHRWGYCSWLYTATRDLATVTGNERLLSDLLDDAVRYYRRWEEGFERSGWPHAGKFRMGGDGKGGFLSIDNYEGTEISLGGNGYKPLMSSAMWSEANAIAEVARAAGRTELADEFAAKAAKNLGSLLANCWNEDVGFFTTARADGTKGTVRELHGYAPWYFGVPTGKPADWSRLSDPQGFAARYGLTFPERRAKGFTIDYRGHECKWNGPSWPFATSIALTALANDLHSQSNNQTIKQPTNLFASLLWQYADAQRLTHPIPQKGGDWEVVPWIDENLHPDKAEWLSRKIILDTPSMRKSFPRERGKDYNHSTFCDLVISGLVGFQPNGAKGFAVDPLFPATWDYLVLENLRYRGHDVDIRWQRGKGLSVEVDGRETSRREALGRLEVAWTAEKTPVDFSAATGPVKPVNGIGQPPMIGMPIRSSMFHYLKEAGIPYSRLHDVGGWQGQHRYVDIPNVFPDFDADENDPKNYRFDCTDILIRNLVQNGVEPFYRLGVSIENPWEWGMKIGTRERIVPPKDFAKWARICEHVIRHYTEGWANGFKYKMTYWEIWNEPDNRENPSISPLWQAPFSEYIRFYGVVAPYLKAKFPHLKIGGFGCCGFYDAVGADAVGAAHSSPRTVHFVQCAKDFLAAARDNGWPVDFFSYHSYSDAPDALKQVAYADRLLDGYGFTADRTERIYNEWLPVVAHENLGTAKQAAQIAAELIGLQNGPCDMACIYDGRCGIGNYSPLFNPMTYRPHKAYYAFCAFNELRKLGVAVKPPKTPEGVYVAAATDGKGKAAVLVANISGGDWTPDFDFGGRGIRSAKVTDASRTYADAAFSGTVANDSFWLFALDAVSCAASSGIPVSSAVAAGRSPSSCAPIEANAAEDPPDGIGLGGLTRVLQM